MSAAGALAESAEEITRLKARVTELEQERDQLLGENNVLHTITENWKREIDRARELQKGAEDAAARAIARWVGHRCSDVA